MKKLPLLIACGLGLAGSLMSVSSALAKNDAGNNVHIDQNRQFPETRWAAPTITSGFMCPAIVEQ
jgi:hypothetical protein